MIRPAKLLDVPAMLDLAQRMHAESAYARLEWSRAKLADVLPALIDNPMALAIVAVKNGAVIGGFLGVVEEHFFSREKFSFDLATFIAPEHRGGFAGPALLKAYVTWAKGLGIACINGGVANAINHNTAIKVFERLGFVQTGVTFEYQGKP